MPRLTWRRLILVTSVGGLVGASTLVFAVLSGRLSIEAAAVVALAASNIGFLFLVGLGMRRFSQQLKSQRSLVNTLQNRPAEWAGQFREAASDAALLFKEASHTFAEDRVEQYARLVQIAGKVDEVVWRLNQSESTLTAIGENVDQLQKRMLLVEPIAEAIDSAQTEQVKLAEAIDSAQSEQVKLHDRLYAKVEAQADLRDLVTLRAPMPAMGGWALDADVLHLVVQTMWQRRPALIVECGSGTSSIWLGYFAERLGVGRVVALEHDTQFLETSRELVRDHGLQSIVEIRHAPLSIWPDATSRKHYNWYSRAVVNDLHGIGLLLVDGPPAAIGKHSRYPAGPLLFPRCSGNAVVILDDANREDERELSDRWLTEWTDFERMETASGSAHVLSRQASAAARREN